MGRRKSGADNVHTDRDQVEAIEATVPYGAELEMLPHELDVSGGLPLEQRPSLRRAVEGVENGTYDGLILAYHSRLFRNVEEEEALWRRVAAAGGEVLLAVDPVDNKTVDGRMLRRIKAAQHAAERERHVEMFDRRRRDATAAGIWQRRQTPLGYDRDTTTRKLVPNSRAEDLRWAFRHHGGGGQIVEIARRLQMTPSGVRHLLKNRVYLGELTVGQHTNPTAHPPLISIEEFEAAQIGVSRGPRRAQAPALLAGLARCAGCGHAMPRGGHPHLPVYECTRHHSGGACPAPAAITLKLLDAFVEPIVLAEISKLSGRAAGKDHVAPAKQALFEAEAELTAYVTATSAADIGAAAFATGARVRKDAVDAAREQLRVELRRRSAMPVRADAWDLLDGQQRNHLLRGLLAGVIVERAGGRGSRTPIDERVRVIAVGAPIVFPTGGHGKAGGIVRIPLPDLDDEGVLRPLR